MGKITPGILLTFATVILGAGFLLLKPAARGYIQNEVFDQYQRLRPRAYQAVPVRIAAIDEESLKRVGQWPWPRTVMAGVVRNLQDAGASVIGFGIVFAEADRTSPRSMIEVWKATGPMREQLLAAPDHDEVLRQAFKRGSVVLGFAAASAGYGATMTAVDGSVAKGRPNRVVGTVGGDKAALPHLHGFSDTVPAIAGLQDAAAGNGSLTYIPDNDGVVRRVPLLVRVDDQVMPSLIAEVLRVAQRQQDYAVISGTGGVKALKVGNVIVPTNISGELSVYYTRPAAERYLPAWQILEGKLARGSLSGQMVLVGASAEGLGEMHFSPLGDHVPAIEVLAQALEQALSGKRLYRPAWASGLEMFALIVGGLFAGVVALRSSALVSAAATALLLAGLGLAGWLAFTQAGLLLDLVSPGLILVVTFITGSVVRHVSSEREQRWVREAFSKYVSPSVVDQLIAAPDLLRLGGERREVTILFSDLAGFTSIAEALPSEQVAAIINRHLSEATETIQRHGGTVDKFIGDGVMAFWGAPIADPRQAAHAVRAAIDMQREMAAMRAEVQRQMGVELHMRIGINRGECIVGNMGGKSHFNYTLMGDAVNLASRIEGVNKVYGTGILVSGAVAHTAAGDLRFREIDTVRVKGKHDGTTLYAPCDDETLIGLSATALDAYRKGDFTQALLRWREIAARYPDDPVATVFVARLDSFVDRPPAAWDGITTLDAK